MILVPSRLPLVFLRCVSVSIPCVTVRIGGCIGPFWGGIWACIGHVRCTGVHAHAYVLRATCP